MKKLLLLLTFIPLFISCYSVQRECSDFKTGEFEFHYTVNGEEHVNKFTRTDSLEFEYVEGKVDTNSVKWINDCEFVVRKLNPKSNSDKKAVHIKILKTSEDAYTFEYSLVGDSKNKQKGTAIKIN
ncbi:hypothetical protein SAMN04487906_2522 [Zhouia amylolytica]|uniref:DNA topoisomerase IV n=1 Tax=Zhouia amylolytica TaxID=376730 RepID=A0A1I6UJL6_9FLAO|nr:hypothetical protein [Zhouia amylolytica]MCQ0112725.1 hypothetical protein [Zhouia amylolytica]SFT01655.1 hypothetical protein SAMN04487906_2522 [Zhouia amylolytica]